MVYLLVVACLTTVASATSDTTANVLEQTWNDLRRTPHRLVLEPLPSLAASAGSIAAIVWISGADASIRQTVLQHRSSTLDVLARIGNTAGDVPGMLAAPLLLIAGGLVFNSHHTVTSGRLLIEALALAGAVTTAVKIAVGRARPFTHRGDGYFLPFRWDDAQWSFPSGHATVAGTFLGTALARSESPLVHGSVGLLALTIVGARVYSDKHWTSDVIAGATIGGAIGYAVAHTREKSSSWILTPIPGGICLVAAW